MTSKENHAVPKEPLLEVIRVLCCNACSHEIFHKIGNPLPTYCECCHKPFVHGWDDLIRKRLRA